MDKSRSPDRHLVLCLAPVAMLFAALWSRLPLQDAPTYFAFADQRSWAGVPHAWNVLTNLPFVAVAWLCAHRLGFDSAPAYRLAGRWLASGVLLTAFGSAWFHWDPAPATLFWDRLPMALTFAGVFLLLVTDRFGDALGLRLGWILPSAAVTTVLVWRLGDNLRPYLALQFGLMVAAPVLTLARPARRIPHRAVWWLLGAYSAAKVLEVEDLAMLHALGDTVAGHALKHMLAAIALAAFVQQIRVAEPDV